MKLYPFVLQVMNTLLVQALVMQIELIRQWVSQRVQDVLNMLLSHLDTNLLI